jgi:hypothetical protein
MTANLKAAEPPAVTYAIMLGTAALATGGLGMGIGFTIGANRKSSSARAIRERLGGPSVCYGQPPPERVSDCSAVKQAAESWDTYTDTAIAGYVIGGFAAATTAGVYLMWPKPHAERNASIRILPWTGASGGGVGVSGAF